MAAATTSTPARAATLRLLAAAVAAALVAFGAARAPAAENAAAGEPPNVLVVITDDQRDGDESMAVMPEAQRLFAGGGTAFTNAYATTPMCCPSRASIFSGRYVHNHGVTSNGADLARTGRTWQRHLDDAGYETAIYGKYLNSWLDRKPRAAVPHFDDSWQGYGPRHEKNPLEAERFLAERAAAFLGETERSDARPWAMVLSTRAPHAPYRYPDRFEREIAAFLPKPSVRDDLRDKPGIVRHAARALQRRIRHGAKQLRPRNVYAGQLHELMAADELVGAVFEQLRELSEDERTLAILVSDNGFFWGEHSLRGKKFPYRESVEVPLYVRWPGRVPAGTVDERIVANIDIAPTIMDAAGVTPHYRPDGRSLLDPASARRGLLLEGPKRMWRSYLTPRGQYIRWRGGPREYYDLARDPLQQHNALASTADIVGRRHARAVQRRALTVSRRAARRKARRMHHAMRRAGRCAGAACP